MKVKKFKKQATKLHRKSQNTLLPHLVTGLAAATAFSGVALASNNTSLDASGSTEPLNVNITTSKIKTDILGQNATNAKNNNITINSDSASSPVQIPGNDSAAVNTISFIAANASINADSNTLKIRAANIAYSTSVINAQANNNTTNNKFIATNIETTRQVQGPGHLFNVITTSSSNLNASGNTLSITKNSSLNQGLFDGSTYGQSTKFTPLLQGNATNVLVNGEAHAGSYIKDNNLTIESLDTINLTYKLAGSATAVFINNSNAKANVNNTTLRIYQSTVSGTAIGVNHLGSGNAYGTKVFLEKQASNSGGVYGAKLTSGSANNTELLSNNSSIKNGGNAYAAYTETGTINNSVVKLFGGSEVSGSVYAAYISKGEDKYSEGNILNITNGSKVTGNATAIFMGRGAAKNTRVYISDKAEIAGNVTGVHINNTAQNSAMNDVLIEISKNAIIKGEVRGVVTAGKGKIEGINVTTSGATLEGSLYGVVASGEANLENSKIIINNTTGQANLQTSSGRGIFALSTTGSGNITGGEIVFGNNSNYTTTGNGYVVGGFSNSTNGGNINLSKVTINNSSLNIVGKDATKHALIAGGYAAGGSGSANKNELNFQSGLINITGQTAWYWFAGGYSASNNAIENKVLFADSTQASTDIIGGYAGSVAQKNNVSIGKKVTITGNVVGGVALGGKAEGNNVTVAAESKISGGVFGGLSAASNASSNNIVLNKINISGSTQTLTIHINATNPNQKITAATGGSVAGGFTLKGSSNKNNVTITNGSTISGLVIGGGAQSASTENNNVTIVGSTVGTAFGGYDVAAVGGAIQANNKPILSTATGVANGNFVNLTNVTTTGVKEVNFDTSNATTKYDVEGNVFGGLASLNGSKDNKVFIHANSTIKGTVLGGGSFGGASLNNTVEIKGEAAGKENIIQAAVFGGLAQGLKEVSNNTVTLENVNVTGEVRNASFSYATQFKFEVGGTVGGGLTYGTGNVKDNVIKVKNSDLKGSVIAGGALNGTVESNNVTLENVKVGGNIYGGYNINASGFKDTVNPLTNTSSAANSNIVNISGVSTTGSSNYTLLGHKFDTEGNVIGGYAGNQGASSNKVFINDSTATTKSDINGSVIGGGSFYGKAENNEVVVSGKNNATKTQINGGVFGGLSGGVNGAGADVVGNKITLSFVNLTGSTSKLTFGKGAGGFQAGGSVIGGYSMFKQGVVKDNLVEIKNAYAHGSIVGGSGGAEVKNNSVVLENLTIGGNVIGGKTNGATGGSNNKVELSGVEVKGGTNISEPGQAVSKANGDVFAAVVKDGKVEHSSVNLTNANVAGSVFGVSANGSASANNTSVSLANAQVKGGVTGVFGAGNGAVSNVEVKIDEKSKTEGSVIGATSANKGDVSGVKVTNNAAIGGSLIGVANAGKAENVEVFTNNSTTGDVIGVANASGDVKNVTLTVKHEVGGSVVGVNNSTGKVEGVTVSVEKNVGGSVVGANASGNVTKVNVSISASVKGNVTGAYSQKESATFNNVTIKGNGSTVIGTDANSGTIIGGYGEKDAKNNTVNVSKINTTGQVIGGWANNGNASGNTVIIDQSYIATSKNPDPASKNNKYTYNTNDTKGIAVIGGYALNGNAFENSVKVVNSTIYGHICVSYQEKKGFNDNASSGGNMDNNASGANWRGRIEVVNSTVSGSFLKVCGNNNSYQVAENVVSANSTINDTEIKNGSLDDSNITNSNVTDSNINTSNASNDNITNSNISNSNVSNSNVSGANITNTSVNNTTVTNANVSNSNLSNGKVCVANISGANLRKEEICDSNTTKSNITESNVTNSNVTESNLTDSNLNNSNVSGSNLTNTNITNANVSKNNVTNANVSNANITDTNLTNANVTEANVSGSNITNANFSNANITNNSTIVNANITNANITGGTLNNTSVSNANVSDIVVSKLNNTTFNDSNITKANITDIDFNGLNVSDSNISGGNISNSNLTNGKVCDAAISDANLRNETICDSNVTKSNISESNVTNSNLTDTRVEGSNVTNANLKNATIEGSNFTAIDTNESLTNATFAPNATFSNSNITAAKTNNSSINLTADLSKVNMTNSSFTGASSKDGDVWVNVTGGVNGTDFVGGATTNGSATAFVNFTNSNINGNFTAASSQNKNATGATELSNTSVSGDIIAGVTTGGNASNINLTLSNITAGGDIYAGWVKDNANGWASNNTVSLSGQINASNSTLYGGFVQSGTTSSGKIEINNSKNNTLIVNTLNASLKDIKNFDFIKFLIPTNVTVNDTLLNLTGTGVTDLSKTNFTIAPEIDAGKSFTDKLEGTINITLIKKQDGTLNLGENYANRTTLEDFTVRYNYIYHLLNNNTFVLEFTKLVADEQKALLESSLAGVRAAVQNQDVIEDFIFNLNGNNTNQSSEIYGGSLEYTKMKSYTGSHIITKSTGFAVGAAKTQDDALFYGSFLEGSYGSFETYNHFKTGDIRGEGHTLSGGLGLFAKVHFGEDYLNSAYLSARVGQLKTSYESADAKIEKHSTRRFYLGVSGQYARKVAAWREGDFELYTRASYINVLSDEETIGGQPLKFDAVQSLTTKGGFRYNEHFGEKLKSYIDVAYEYEFEGSADAYNKKQRYAVSDYFAAPTLHGGSGLGEIGVTYTQSKNGGFVVNVKLKGSVGKNRGWGGGFDATYKF